MPYSIVDPTRNPPRKKIPQNLRFGMFAAIALLVSLTAGLIYLLITVISFILLFGARILIYPGMLAGMLAGYALHFFKRKIKLPENATYFVIVICAGLVVFITRWWIEASRSSDQGILAYLISEAHIERDIFFARTGHPHYHGETPSSPLKFWFLFLLEGLATVLATKKIADDGYLG